MSSILSPNAPVYYSRDSGIQIYNDGLPCLIMYSEEGINEILHGISDEVLDENVVFPMSATEAAELEAVETYVDMMATLDWLESQEETARNDLSTVRGTRWEARRVQGGGVMKGKHNNHEQEVHPHASHVKNPHLSIILFSHRHKRQLRSCRPNNNVAMNGGMDYRHPTSHHAGTMRHLPIHQPRKFN
jgi:hypothetical protein